MRLRSAYFVTCREVVKDDAGNDRRAALHVRPRHARRRRSRRPPPQGDAALAVGRSRRARRGALYDYLFTSPYPGAEGDLFDDLNPDSETVLQGCLVEPSLADVPVGETVQFERLGYFCPDPDSAPGALVFNRTLTLRDTWAKLQAQGRQG